MQATQYIKFYENVGHSVVQNLQNLGTAWRKFYAFEKAVGSIGDVRE